MIIESANPHGANDYFYVAGYLHLRHYHTLKYKIKNIIILTPNNDILSYAQANGYRVQYFKHTTNDITLRNPLHFFIELNKYMKAVSEFISTNNGARLIHSVDTVDYLFFYKEKKCRESKTISIYKVINNNQIITRISRLSYAGIYLSVISFLYGIIFKIRLNPVLVNGEPMLYRDYNHENLLLNLEPPEQGPTHPEPTKRNISISGRIVFLLGHSPYMDSRSYSASDLDRLFLQLRHYGVPILYKLHPGYPDYFPLDKNNNGIEYFQPTYLPTQDIHFTNCIILTLNSSGLIGISREKSIQCYSLIDMLEKKGAWNHKAYKDWLIASDPRIKFIRTYKQLDVIINEFIKDNLVK